MGVTVSKRNQSASLTRNPSMALSSKSNENAPTDEKRHQLPPPPPPAPPKKKKHEIFNEKDYKEVAIHVAKVPRDLQRGTFRDLVNYLTSNPKWNDLAKLRAIFLWITSIDIYNLAIDTEPPKHSPMEYFMKIQKNHGNHAHLFSGLCQMANIHCMIVSGMNKSAAYEIGKKVNRKTMGAQWNAAYVQHSWRFIDSFWASACVVGRRSGEWALIDSDWNAHDEEEVHEGKTEHRVNEFYFMPDPDQLILTHFPDEKPWQLLQKPMTLAEFEDHFYVRERFHILGMRVAPTSHRSATIKTSGGEVYIYFSLTSKDSENYRFKYMLYKSKMNEDPGSKADMFLERFVFFEHTSKMVKFSMRFPMAGTFKMDIYGLDVRESDIFDLACTYLIDCPEPKTGCLPFPDCPALGWGPGPAAAKAGLTPISHEGSTIVTNDGKVDIQFAIKSGMKIELHQGLKHAALDEATLSKYVLILQEKGKTTIKLRLPHRGEYALKLFAQNPDNTGEAPNVCNYLIKCDGVDPKGESFPHVAGGVLGKHHLADKLGVKAVSHPDGVVEAKEGKLSVKFTAKDDLDLVCELNSNNASATKTMAVAKKQQQGEWTFDADLPKAGEYSLNVFAKGKGKEQRSRIHSVHAYQVTSTGRPGFSDGESDANGNDQTVTAIPTETVETSESEAVIPIPPECKNPKVEMYKRNANDSPTSDQIDLASQDDSQLVTVKMKDYGDYMLNIYDTDDAGNVKVMSRYQVNRKRPGELYTNNLQTIMDTLQEEGMKPSSEALDSDDNKAKATEEEKLRYAQRQIERAIDLKDEAQLKKAISQYVETNPPEDDPLLVKARDQLEMLKAKYAMQDASQKRDLNALESAIKKAKAVNKNRELDLQIAMTSKLRDHLARIEKLRHAVLSMEQTTISELKSYSKPPEGVAQVMAATLILLGSKPSEVKKWKNVLILMGKTGKESLMRKVSLFNAQNVTLSSAKASKKFIGTITKDQIRSVSAGAATFYLWATSMIEEVESFGGAEASDTRRLKR
ncbi:uncharacterized protein LOC121374291 [Gigantopelta aegis]|uniref:uncharacterized protein LOC121374291 n=1 Tax=Gigantopelta aegis TaxID=1735272 RepID=UPI001B88E71B|nr:uncharacterized protein LOC121374291 [Gigantopelta aegis]XP_041357268.1 uncharacterized protein LOC121374291 [Gigantopelta aegis]